MSQNTERERLRAVYSEQSDGELLRLHDERDGLTETAQAALAEIMSQRGLELSAVDTVHGPSAAATADSSAPGLSPEEVLLYIFRDTFELREAINLLETANVEVRVMDRRVLDPQDLSSRNENQICLIVKRTEQKRATMLLRDSLHLFPGPESDGHADIALPPPRELALLFLCAREDAFGMVQALSATGISFFWRDGRDDKGLPDEDTVAIEVHPSQHARAEQAVKDWLTASATEFDEDDPSSQP